MVRSMEEDPDFIEERPVLAVPGPDETLVVFCHNLYTKGAQASGRKSVACVTYFPESEEDRETIRRRALKDNGSFGSWDTEILANEWEFETWDLEAMGVPDWVTGGAGGAQQPGAPAPAPASSPSKTGEMNPDDLGEFVDMTIRLRAEEFSFVKRALNEAGETDREGLLKILGYDAE
ncbi:MAG: hypothetical protein IKE76_09755 [Clostridia bacterium]|nr:hypothetical protein [Clostridia bacterium]